MALGKPAVVADGDKGDITVSSSGDTWTIDNSVVDTSNLGGDITTAGKALLDDADAAAQRTTLGLGTMATANSADYLPLAGGTMTGTLTVNDTNLTLRDNADTTKQAQFELSGITTATTRTYTLPNLTGTLATLGNLSQTFSGATTFSNTVSATGSTFTAGGGTGTTTVNIASASTTGTNTKTINIGNNHVGTGGTTIGIGNAAGTNTSTEITIGSSGAGMTSLYGGLHARSLKTDRFHSDSINAVRQYTGFLDSTQVTYDSKSKSVASEDATPTGMYFKPDGTSVFILGDTTDRVYRYDLSTPWDISTAGAVASTSPSLAAQATAVSGLEFKPDGTIMYVGGHANAAIYQYTLSTPWDVSTATYANKSASLPTTTAIQGLFVYGLSLIYVTAGGYIYRRTFAPPEWDLANLSADTRDNGRLYYWGSVGGAYLCPTTGILFYGGSTSQYVAIQRLWPYDVISNNSSLGICRPLGNYDNSTENDFTLGVAELSLKALWYNHANRKFYTLGHTLATIHQHSIGWNPTTSWSTVSSYADDCSIHLGYNHFEGGVWYNDVRLDQRLAPAGGTTSQVLRKASNTNWDYSWSSLSTSDISGLGTIATASSSDYVSSTGGTVTGNLTVTGEITAAGGGFEDALYIDLQQNYGGF